MRKWKLPQQKLVMQSETVKMMTHREQNMLRYPKFQQTEFESK